MKILHVHNHYGSSSPSGENNTVVAERQLLISSGVNVINFDMFSDDYSVDSLQSKFSAAKNVVWSRSSKSRFNALLRADKPDIIHVHNTFPFISPSIFWANVERIPIVMTVHNFRTICAKAIPLRNGNVCLSCIEKRSSYSAVRFGCYRNSRLATLPLAVSVDLHRKINTWSKISAHIFLTNFQRRLFEDNGLTVNRSFVKPNPNPFVGTRNLLISQREGVCFIGRLSEEKGIEELISAWNIMGENAPILTIAGDGPLKPKLHNMSFENSRIKFIGHVSQSVTQNLLQSSRLCVIPSKWFEGYPLVLSDAIAAQTPVLLSNIGSLKEVGQDLQLPMFDHHSMSDLISKVYGIYENFIQLNKMQDRMLNYYLQHLEPTRNTQQLLSIYDRLLTND
jgi:glycosyltransferase involved in cell wall biosynthesis